MSFSKCYYPCQSGLCNFSFLNNSLTQINSTLNSKPFDYLGYLLYDFGQQHYCIFGVNCIFNKGNMCVGIWCRWKSLKLKASKEERKQKWFVLLHCAFWWLLSASSWLSSLQCRCIFGERAHNFRSSKAPGSLLAEVSHDEAKWNDRREVSLLSFHFASSWETSASRESPRRSGLKLVRGLGRNELVRLVERGREEKEKFPAFFFLS